MQKLINLHTNTEYSFLQSTIKISSLIEYAKQHQLKHLVITDRDNMFGVAKFYNECKANNINPIIGLDLEIKSFRFILIAKNYQGFLHLSLLSSKKMSFKEIEIEELDNENIIVIDHPKLGLYSKTKKMLEFSNYFVHSNDSKIANSVYVQTRNVLYASEEKYLKILHKIADSSEKDEAVDFIDFEMWYEQVDEQIIQRTNFLVENILIEFPEANMILPDFKNEANLNPDEFLQQLLEKQVAKKKAEFKNFPNFKERLVYEFNIIKSLKFSNYFLIIWDFLRWARKNNILIGPGRGSSSGSLISYLLNITQVNPLKFDLIFERFLNPKRISMPDIDIDIQDNRRDELIQYIQQKYGYENTALIITFSTFGAKMAFADVAKKLKNVSPTDVLAITKHIPFGLSLEQAYKTNANFRAYVEKQDNNGNFLYKEIFEIAKFLEGMPRQSGTHAAGIVIADKPLYNYVPTLISKDKYNQTQFSAEFLEQFSLLKIDLLGLKNLTVVKGIINSINQHSNLNFNFNSIPIFDKGTNELLTRGKTVGIFQLESPGMANTLRKVGISSIDDVVAVISLFRPGPIKNIPLYAQRKKNEADYEIISQEYNDILKSTYGIIIYQEQIMQICQTIAGFDFATSDLIRRAISKKEAKKLYKAKQLFIQGGLNKGYSAVVLEKIFQQIEYFAEYGFNKSHAVAYATLAYKMAYLKQNYPLEFYSFLITNEEGSQTNIAKFIKEAQPAIKFKKPNINISTTSVVYERKTSTIYLPLILIKGLGRVACQKILEERNKNGLYKDFLDFVIRMKIINISNTIITLLINSGTLSEFGNIPTLLENLVTAESYKICILEDENKNLYCDYSLIPGKFELEIKEDNLELTIENEEKLLGMSFSSFDQNIDLKNPVLLSELSLNVEYRMVLYVKKVANLTAKTGAWMKKITLTDFQSPDQDIWLFGSKVTFFEAVKEKQYYEFLIIKIKDKLILQNHLKEMRYD